MRAEAVRPVFQQITDSFRESLDQMNEVLRRDFAQEISRLQDNPADKPFVPPVWGETPWVFRSIIVDPPYADRRRSGPMDTALARRARPFVCPRHGEQSGGFCRTCQRGR